VELTFSVGYSNLKYNNEYFINEIMTEFNAAVVNFNPDWSANIVPVKLGARYKFPTKDFTPYFSGEIGLQLFNFDERFNGTRISDSSTNQSLMYINDGSASETEFGFTAALGAGLEIPAAENVMINIGFKYNYGGVVYSKSYEIFREIDNSSYTSEELKNISYISGLIGVEIGF
jgi:opacity protein-like surface antigen